MEVNFSPLTTVRVLLTEECFIRDDPSLSRGATIYTHFHKGMPFMYF